MNTMKIVRMRRGGFCSKNLCSDFKEPNRQFLTSWHKGNEEDDETATETKLEAKFAQTVAEK